MALRLNCNRIVNEIINNKIKKIIASVILTLFKTNDRCDVLSIFLSILRSTKSFTIHPALRMKNDPTKKKKYHFKLLSGLIGKEAKENQQGHINSMKPIGLSKRIKSRKDLILLGIE